MNNKPSLEQVMEFSKAFDFPIHDKPHINDVQLNWFRAKLLREEIGELCAALLAGTEEDVLDALCDIQYVLDGAFISLGFHRYKDRAFAEVHKTNMAKLGPDGKPIRNKDGKVMKPEGWVPPNLKGILSLD